MSADCRSPVHNIVMCLSAGRCGTSLLSQLLALCNNIHSVHEPEPTFLPIVEGTGSYSLEKAEVFVRDIKLSAIFSKSVPNYAETSHLFGKGAFEAFLALKVPFQLIRLHRAPREVAKSHWRIKAIPARNEKKKAFVLHPALDTVMQLPSWKRLTSYQLCFWYCLEIERRKDTYKIQAEQCGIPVVDVHLGDLLNFDSFHKLCAQLSLELPEACGSAHQNLVSQKINRKKRYLPKISFRSLASQEEEVWALLGEDGERLRLRCCERYGEC